MNIYTRIYLFFKIYLFHPHMYKNIKKICIEKSLSRFSSQLKLRFNALSAIVCVMHPNRINFIFYFIRPKKNGRATERIVYIWSYLAILTERKNSGNRETKYYKRVNIQTMVFPTS